jgi:ElaB/YqjD/DUF883 family membrane-anchored ribosome-binding protein
MSTKIDSPAGEPRTVDEARDAVERSRQRISTTLDQLEYRIVEKKHEIQDRVDVLRPVRDQIRERPFTALAVAAGVGALLGSLGGGDDDDFDGRHRHSRSGRVRGAELSEDDRQELREWRRARRNRLRTRLKESRDDGRDEHDDHEDSRFDALKHQLMGAVTSAITTAVTRRVRRLAMDNVSSIVDSVTGGGDDRPESRGEGRDTGRGAYR